MVGKEKTMKNIKRVQEKLKELREKRDLMLSGELNYAERGMLLSITVHIKISPLIFQKKDLQKLWKVNVIRSFWSRKERFRSWLWRL